MYAIAQNKDNYMFLPRKTSENKREMTPDTFSFRFTPGNEKIVRHPDGELGENRN